MKRFMIVIISVISLLLMLCAPISAQSNNLAVNNSFEENEGNDPYFWMSSSWENTGKLQLDKTQAYSGQASALIINDIATDSRFKQQINVKSETYYKLSCWIKTENVGPDAKGANLSIEGLIDTSNDIKGTSNDWNYVELFGVSGKGQKNFILTIGLGGYSSLNTGKAWFDDVVVEELASVPEQGNVVKLYTDTAETASINKEKASGWNLGLLLLLAAAVLLAVAAFIILKRRKPVRPLNSESTETPIKVGIQPTIFKLQLDKKDWLIMACMTLIYLIIAIPNLGSLKAPVTSWTPANQGESFIVDLGSKITPGPIYYYGGLGYTRPNSGKYRLQYLESTDKYKPLATIEKNDGNIFVWQYVNSPDINSSDIKTRYVRIIVDSPGGTLNELVFFEKGSKVPLHGVKIVEDNTSPDDEGNVYSLFDEPDTVDYSHTYLSGMIFDEIYHARTAYEYLNGMEPYEWTHPPLGKLFISLGILIFGMDPFGWRIVGTLFGAAMVPIMYMFGKKLFSTRFYGFCSAFLIMFDFMHFGLSRIATIDVYATFFIILMYYFMVDYYMNKSWQLGFKQSLKPLFLSGLFFGLGAASKWIGLYAGGGLALLFFLAKYSEYRDYQKAMAQKGKKASWLNSFIPLYITKTFIYCGIFFVIIPGVIYMLSYIPYISAPGHNFSVIFSNQAAMLKYHSKDVLSATHPYSSLFWEWPIMSKPLLTYYGTDLQSGISSSMTIMGNPAIWWFGILAIIASIIIAIRKRDKKMIVVFTAIAFQYLPWFGITRIVFIYHFFSSVPFMILSIVYILKNLMEGSQPQMKYVIYGYLTLVLVLFIMFYPVLSGLEVTRNYVLNYLQWFKSKWTF